MSLKVKTDIFQKLNFTNAEIMLYDYARFFFDDNSVLAGEFAEEINSRKNDINERNNTEINAYQMGKNDSLVMVEGLGSLLERNPDDFNMILTLVKRYVMDTTEGSADELIDVSGRRTQKKKSSSDSATVVKRPKKKKKTTASTSDDKMKSTGEIEEYIASYIQDQEVATCTEIQTHITNRFDADEEEARQIIDKWAEKNGSSIEYDPDYEKGEGLICLV